MEAIPSPYYFVPLEDYVYLPEWGGGVSHDIPFSDGLSGELEIEVEAMRPIYVRNTAEKPADLKRFHSSSREHPDAQATAQFKEWASFYKLGDRYAIPATSIRGAIRNVIKIASFGSFREAVSDHPENDERYSVRDLYLKPYQNRFVRGGKCLSQGGWLRKEGNVWKMYPSDYQRVDQSALADFAKIRWDDFLNTAKCDKDHDPKQSAVKAKNEMWLKHSGTLEIDYVKGKEIDQTGNGRHLTTGAGGKPLHLTYALASSLGSKTDRGHLVFTGQPSSRRPPKNKHMEFIFELPGACLSKGRATELEARQIRDFEFVHAESRAWKYWQPKFDRGDFVPVFWIAPAPGQPKGNGLQALGLAQMFRYPADRTLRDGILPKHREPGHDLADLVFGSLRGNELRGRATFSHFLAEGSPKSPGAVWTVLGSPKPTFYPNYLEQEYTPQTGRLNANDYRTLMSDRIQLRGWKRYAVRPDAKKEEVTLPKAHDFTREEPSSFDAATAFAPLPPGTKFTGKLRFHNLRPMELGALIWAIEWGGHQNLRHLLGMGKGLGLGSVKMSIRKPQDCSFEKANGSGKVTAEDARKFFAGEMEKARPGWSRSDALCELLLLADSTINLPDGTLAYPRLEVGGNNQFTLAKHRNNPPLVLRSYGEATGKHTRTPWKPAQAPSPAGP